MPNCRRDVLEKTLVEPGMGSPKCLMTEKRDLLFLSPMKRLVLINASAGAGAVLTLAVIAAGLIVALIPARASH